MRMYNPLWCAVFALVLLEISVKTVETIEPVTTGIAVAGALAASAFFAGFSCKFYECCEEPWVKPNITGLAITLQKRLYGQHLVAKTVIQSIRGHWQNKNPSKALVMSFHGWTGGGKNYVSRIIAEHLYAKGMQSSMVHLYVSTLHFPHISMVPFYKDRLHDWIRGNVSKCGRSLFIFDEMDKMPSGLIDTIKPYLDHYPEINGIDFRKATFIFLSNTGGRDINEYAKQHWLAGKDRQTISLKEMEEILLKGSFNEKGGLWHSELIEKHLIDAFIPFLPLERRHVKMCIQDDLRAKRIAETEELLDKVADEMQYGPPTIEIFSASGCKRVSQKVDYIREHQQYPHSEL